MTLTTVSDKYQIVIPKSEREKIGLKKGQKMVIYHIGTHLVLSPQIKNYTEKLAGLGENIWKDIDSLEYIKKERKLWDKK